MVVNGRIIINVCRESSLIIEEDSVASAEFLVSRELSSSPFHSNGSDGLFHRKFL
jgi:hypothetical protein